jgi:DNA repair exonuclease SbcCD ATPase subunit
MDQIETKICAIIQEMSDCNIQSLTEMKDGFLLTNLLSCINPEFFPTHKIIKDWNSAEHRLQEYLNYNGLDEILDFDLEEIQNGHKESLVSAIFQILAIYAVFNPKGWDKTINSVEYDTKYSIMMILQKMINKIQFELSVAQQNLNTSSSGGSNDFKQLLQKLEYQENILNQNQNELLEKTNTIFSLRKEIQKVKEELSHKTKEFIEDKKRKEETIKYLEEAYGAKKDEKNIEKLEETIKDLEIEKNNIYHENKRLEKIIDEKDSEVEKLKILKDLIETREKELETAQEQLSYYAKVIEKLKNESEIEKTKSQILNKADQNVKELKIELEKEKTKNWLIIKSKSEIEGELEKFKRKVSLANDKVDFIRRRSTAMTPNNIHLLQGNFIEGLENENSDLKTRLEDALAKLREVDLESYTHLLEQINEFEAMASKIKILTLENEMLTKNNHLLAQQSTTDMLNNKMSSLQNIIEMEEEYDEKNINNILSKPESYNELHQNKFDEDFYDIFYSLSMETIRDNIMQKRLLVPNQFERKRDIFSKFTLSNVLKH